MRNHPPLLPVLALLALLAASCESPTDAAGSPGAAPSCAACGGEPCGGGGCCGACSTAAPAAGPASEAVPGAATDLDAFLADHPYRDPDLWFSVDVSRSVVTGTLRRIYVEKEAVTRALLAHPGGEAPMKYPAGTVFVAESLAPDGSRIDTEVLRVRPPGPPFFIFDAGGARTFTFEPVTRSKRDGGSTRVPHVCMMCHAGGETFEPMASFPAEEGGRTLLVDDSLRDPGLVGRFGEARRRGDLLFGPYGALWLARLRCGLRDGTLSDSDAPHADRLSAKYPEVLTPRNR